MSSVIELAPALQGPCEDGRPEPYDTVADDGCDADDDPGIGDATPCQCARCRTWWPAGGTWFMLFGNRVRLCFGCWQAADDAELAELLTQWRRQALLPLDRFTIASPDAQEGGEAA